MDHFNVEYLHRILPVLRVHSIEGTTILEHENEIILKFAYDPVMGNTFFAYSSKVNWVRDFLIVFFSHVRKLFYHWSVKEFFRVKGFLRRVVELSESIHIKRDITAIQVNLPLL